MTSRTGTQRPLAGSVADRLGYAAWALIATGLALSGFSATSGPQNRSILFAVLYLVLLTRLAITAMTSDRRRTVLFLFVSILLWAIGSSILVSTDQPRMTRFPAPGEWFFLASYFTMAIHLVTSSNRGRRTTLSSWLEAVVICGGAVCLAESALLLPLSSGYNHDTVALFLALLYPLIDLVLAIIVLGQLVLGIGGSARATAARVVGFLCLAVADTSFVQGLKGGTYSFGKFDEALWGIGVVLIISAACRRDIAVARRANPRQGTATMMAAASIATGVLALRPGDDISALMTVPAVLTLAAAGARLALALKDARGAAEAILLSRTDDLTMLPNRRAVLARLDEALTSSGPLALMMLDLDGFKEVNDTLGHAAGDTVLQYTAMRIRDALPLEAMVARLGGDEFAVVVNDDDPIRLLEIGQTVLEALGQTTIVEGIELATSGSVGITMRTRADSHSTDLLRRADVAMYQSKLTRAGAVLYDPDRDDFSRHKLQLAEQLRRAILEDQLSLWYQPQIDAATQQVCGLEALVRWNHPEQGMLSPALFLPAARRAGLMLMLSEAVGRMAVTDIERWHAEGVHVRVALNCAPPELLSGLFLPRLFQALDTARLPADSLVIEITEDSFLADPERTRSILSEIRAAGVQIAIDDYGTGFSSLSYLRDLPVQELKMDRSFVSTLRSDPRNQMIVQSTFQMAHALGLRMVAEGVEDAATAADLVAMGVDVLQGYYIARPMQSEDVASWVRQWTPLSSDGFGSVDADPGAA